jgi:hypothetical protein
VILSPIFRVRVRLDGWTGAPGLFTHYFKSPSDPAVAADALTVANRVRAAWATTPGVFSNTVSLTVSPVVDVLDYTNGHLVGSFAVTPPAVINGSAGASPGPSEVAACLTWDSGSVISGRRLRGRTFVSPIQGGYTQTIGTNSSVITGLNAVGVAMIGATPPLAIPLQVWKRPKKDASGAILVPGSIADVMVAYTGSVWAVLRSRRG